MLIFRVMFRLFLFLLIAILILSPWYILAIFLTFGYLFYFEPGYEIIILAILVDGFFGMFFKIPLLSFGALALVSFFIILKPRLLIYN